MVDEERKEGPLFGRPEINCDRILVFARDRMTRVRSLVHSLVSSIYPLVPYRGVPPSLFSFIFAHLPRWEILAARKRYKINLCIARGILSLRKLIKTVSKNIFNRGTNQAILCIEV